MNREIGVKRISGPEEIVFFKRSDAMENIGNGGVDMEFTEVEQGHIKKSFPDGVPEVYKIFNKLELGVLLLDYKRRQIVFSNNYFHVLADNNARIILDHIFKCLGKKRKCMFREVELERGIYIGYSIYQVSGSDYLILVIDISNKKIFLETKEENQYYNKLETFMAEISHEIGNPLTSVIMTLQVLLKNISDWSIYEKKEYIHRSISELKRLSKFLKKIRDFSQENKIEKKSVLLKSVIERFILQNKALLDTKRISFINDVEKTVKVTIDEDAFYQVLFNLFQNSIDSLSGRGKKRMIWVNIEEAGEFFVKLIYKNNGSPIPVDILEKIFMPLFSTNEEGRGMGLNISRKLMTRMGGTIKAEIPKSGWGAKFVLYIPVGEERP